MDIKTHKLEKNTDPGAVAAAVRERDFGLSDVEADVRAILDDVRARGDEALAELTLKFDGASIPRGGIETGGPEAAAALASLDAPLRTALEKACARVKRFAEASLPADWSIEQEPGLTVGQVHRPLETVGIYVPGGRFPYPSTVIMTAIPARVAGVNDIILCVPPRADGTVDPAVLAAASLAGGCRIFKVGGAQAVGAMAFGTASIPRCQMIAGPGNVYVATAKRLVSHLVKVDLEAGPSEVAIICDEASVAASAASDMLAQLEHDPMAVAVLLTDSEQAMESVEKELAAQGDGLEGRCDLVLCGNIDACLALANELAPEHLELMLDGAANLLPRVTTAGCVFIGEESPVAFGDYLAGPSHVLPTGGAANRLSGLRAEDFTRIMNVVRYDEEACGRDSADAIALAELEGLARHARSVDIREGIHQRSAEV